MSHRCIREATYEYACDGVGCDALLVQAQPADHGWGRVTVEIKGFGVHADLCPDCTRRHVVILDSAVSSSMLRQLKDDG